MLILIHYESGYKEELQMDRLPLAVGFIMNRYLNAVERINSLEPLGQDFHAVYSWLKWGFMLRTPTSSPTYTLKHRRTLFYFHERMYSQKYIITVRLRVAAI